MDRHRGKEARVILVEDKANCCGCGACYIICPVKAISMLPDIKGFIYPFIDDTKCVGCRKCVNICIFK